MKQSVMQYLTQHKLVTIQSFPTFAGALIHLLNITEEMDGGQHAFDMYTHQCSSDAIPYQMMDGNVTAWQIHAIDFGDLLISNCIYEIIRDDGYDVRFYVEKDYRYED